MPVRTCVGCRERADKAELVRIVLVGNEVVLDEQGTLPGRGAYVHRDRECAARAVRRRAVGRALRAPGPVATGVLEDLE